MGRNYAALIAVCVLALVGCVDVPEKLDCKNVDCVAVADTLCEAGYFQFCKDLTRDELDRIFACLLFGGENCLDVIDRDTDETELAETVREIYAPDRP